MPVIPDSELMSSSPYLKAADHAGLNKIVTVKSADVDEVTWPDGKTETVYVIDIGKEKPIKLSKTNMRTMVGIGGNNTDDWAGKKVVLATRDYDIDGKATTGWTVSAVPTSDDGPDDDIPF